jgi:hypothetical protein
VTTVTESRRLAICFALLVVLVALAPVFALSAGRISPQLINIAVAVLLLLLPSAPEGDIRSSLAIFKPLAVAALLPAAWMLLQILPLPMGSIEHPVWRSAAAALPDPDSLSGHISIDLGFTLRSLFGYLSLISLAFITCILTRNRERAETILATLCTITTFIALELLLFRDLAALKPANSTDDLTSSLVALAAFGVILNLAFIVRAAERYETRSGPGRPVRSFVGLMLLGTAGAVICLVALITYATYDVLIDTAFGLVVVGLVILIRRLNLARWTATTLCAAVLVACGGVIALRLMADANWTGSGVGSYQALAAIYRDADGAPGPAAINTITSIVLEWGRTGMLLLFLLVIQLLVMLFRGALARGRDSFYAAGAAACLVVAFCEAHCDASFTTVTVQMTAAIIVGLGLAQTTGRKAS